MNGILLALGVAFLKAAWDFWWKFFTSHTSQSIDEYSLWLGIRIFSVIALFPFIIFGDFFIIQDSILLIISTWILNAIATITLLKALKLGELSIVWPLSSVTIPLLMLSWFFISWELPNLAWWIWVWIIFFGSYFLGITQWDTHLLSPIKSLWNNIWARYMLISAVIMSISWPLDKLWILQYGAIHWMFLTNIVVVISIAAYMICTQKKIHLENFYKPRQAIKSCIVSSLWGAWALLQMFALQYTLVIYVLTIKRASGIFSVLLGALFFKEKNIAWKLFASILMIMWVLLISIFGNI